MEKTYILVRSVREGNRLLRRENKKNPGQLTANVSCHHLVEFARNIVLQIRAQEGKLQGVKLLDKISCGVLLDNVIKSNWTAGYFLPKRCRGLSTAMEVLESLNVLRMGQLTEAFLVKCSGTENRKERQLQKLTEEYTGKLKEQDAYDEALLYEEAAGYLECGKQGISLPKGRFFISEDCLELLTALERKFLELLTEGRYQKFSFGQPSGELLQKQVTFFKSYGMANEVEYVAKKMKEEGQKAGEVSVLYTSPEYEPFLRGVFGNRRIPYHLVSGHLAAENRYVAAMLAVMRFAEGGFVYEDLKLLVQMPGLHMTYEEAGETKKANLSDAYFQTIRSGIGWGRQRYLDYINKQRAEAAKEEVLPETEEEKQKAELKKIKKEKFLEFLEELCCIAAPEADGVYSCVEAYWRLTSFVKKYMNAPLDWKEIAPVLPKEAKVLEQLPLLDSEQELIETLKERILALSADEVETQDAVSVMLFGNGTMVLERRYVYILGLSAEAFGRPQLDSAVLSDAERKEALVSGTGFIDLREEREYRRNACLLKTIQTFGDNTEGSRLYLGYSCFDTVELREMSPAVCYLRLREMAGKGEEETEYMGYPDLIEENVNIPEQCVWEKTVEEASEEIKDVPETEEDGAEKGEEKQGPLTVRFSATGLQTLINCPLQYYYQRVKYLPNEDYKARKPEEWLNAAEKGTLVHEILEEYCNRWFKEKVPEEIETGWQEDSFQECVELAVKKMLEQCPYDSQAAHTLELEEVSERCRSYLKSLQESLTAPGNKWRVMECEKAFRDITLYYNESGRCTPENGDIALVFDGFMDRVDYYVDEQGIYHYRILDYKSGKRKKQEEGVKALKKIQHTVYALAMLEECRKKNIKAVVEEVCFLHLFEDKQEDWILAVNGQEIQELPEKVQRIVREVLLQQHYTVLEKLDCNQNVQTRGKNAEKLYQTKDSCEYCTYKDICREKEYMGVEW